MLTRRQSLISVGSATLALLQENAIAQSSMRTERLNLSRSYEGFQQRVTIGNVVGSALHMAKYVWLALGAPVSLVTSISRALGRGGHRVQAASTDYVDYRYETASHDISEATRLVAGDVLADAHIANTLSGAMFSDLQVIQRLLNDQSLSLSVFREQLSALREQVGLLREEQSRSTNGDALYGATEPLVRRSGSQETSMLQTEIQRLRNELNRMRQYAANLESFALRYG